MEEGEDEEEDDDDYQDDDFSSISNRHNALAEEAKDDQSLSSDAPEETELEKHIREA